MEENLNFEEQLIKLNNQKKRKFITKIIVIVFMFLTFGIYLFSPLSKISDFTLTGNYFINKIDILKILNVSSNTSLYSVNEDEYEKGLNNHPLIKSSNVSVSVFGLKVEIEEIAPVLKTGSNDFYCNDGEIRNYDNAFTTCLMPSHYLEEIDKLPVYLNSNNHQLTKSEVCFIQDVYYTLSEEYRNKITYFDYSDEYKYSYFFNLTNDTLYEVVVEFNSSLKESENIAFALDSTAQQNYYKDFLDNPNINLTLKNYQNGETSFEYYSILVKIEYEFGNKKIRYNVSPNE